MTTDDDPLRFADHPTAASVIAFEQAVLDGIDLPLEHVPDAEDDRYDARLTDAVSSSQDVRVVGRCQAASGTPVELKTCQRHIEDRHAWNGYRRGRWKFDRDAHETLTAIDGWYLLAVREPGGVLGWLLTPATTLDPFLAWSPNGAGESRARSDQLPWSVVFEPAAIREGDPDG